MAATPAPKRTLSVDEKYELITSNLQEVIRPDIIREILPQRPLKIYWGTATTGRPHAGYFAPAIKIAQFLQAGCQVKILLADLHGFLDADKAPEGVLENRAQYYERVIRALLRSVGVHLENLEFVRGSSYQTSPAYALDLLRLSKKCSVHDAVKASSEVVKVMGEPVMADGIYPMMQVLDEEYLGVDAEFGGVDQRKIFSLSHDVLHKIGYKVRAHLMNPMVPGLGGGKMSSSDPKSKIDLIDDAATIHKKVSKALCTPGVVEDNGILAFIQHVLLPQSQLHSEDGKPSISILLKDQTEPTVFRSFDEVAAAYTADKLTPQLAKKVVEEGLIKITESIRAEFDADKEWQEITAAAYPEPTAKPKKPAKEDKKKKGKGDQHPKAKAEAGGEKSEEQAKGAEQTSNRVVPVVNGEEHQAT